MPWPDLLDDVIRGRNGCRGEFRKDLEIFRTSMFSHMPWIIHSSDTNHDYKYGPLHIYPKCLDQKLRHIPLYVQIRLR